MEIFYYILLDQFLEFCMNKHTKQIVCTKSGVAEKHSRVVPDVCEPQDSDVLCVRFVINNKKKHFKKLNKTNLKYS